MCRGDRLGERVERAGVHVAGLEYDDRRLIAAACERRLKRVSTQPSLRVDPDRFGRSQTEIAKGEVDSVVPLGADEDTHSWSTAQAALGHVPAGPTQDGIPTSGKSGEVRHGAARHEPDGAVAGQPEQVQQPGTGDVLDSAVRGGGTSQSAVLVPRADQPV